MKNLLTSIGLDDGQGNISSSRIFMMLCALYVFVPKAILYAKTGIPPVITSYDLGILGIGGGVKLVGSQQENQSPASITTSTSVVSTGKSQ